MKMRRDKLIFAALGGLLLFLVTKEAITIPLTHDEGNTIYCSTTPFWDIVTYKDPVPNNHILNTLLIKADTAIFGQSLFIARLHNVLSFIPFFIFTVLLAYGLVRDFWVRMALVLMVTAQPYMLDFFAVTRGYGLSVSFEMISLYYLLRQLQEPNTRNLMATLSFAAIGVYANFTLLNYYLPLSAILMIHSWMVHDRGDKKLFAKNVITVTGIGAALFLVIIVPVKKMVATKQFVFWGTTGFLSDTASPLIVSLRSAVDYFKASNEEIFTYVTGFFVVMIAMGVYLLSRRKERTPAMWFFILPAAVLLYNHLQFYLLDVPFLNARTALFLVPLACIPMAISLDLLLKLWSRFGFVLLLAVNFLLIQHFVRGQKVTGTFEWYYDVNTYDVLDVVKEMTESGHAPRPSRINCYWIFYPSVSYHTDHQYKDNLVMAPWGTKIEDDTESTFYYTERGELDKLRDKFDIIKEYSQGERVLLKRKNP